jgi:hypothetical protein
MTRRARNLAVVAMLPVVAGLGVLLSGCIAETAMSARLVDGNLEIAFCAEYSGDEFKVSELSDDDHVLTDLWIAEGDITVDDGTVVEFGTPPEGATTTFGPRSLKTSDRYIEVVLVGDGYGNASGHYDGDLLEDGSWMRGSQTLVFGPCGLF